MPTGPSPFTYCSAAALRMAARRVSQFYDGYLAPEGLKVSQYSVLSIAARRREKPPTVTSSPRSSAWTARRLAIIFARSNAMGSSRSKATRKTSV